MRIRVVGIAQIADLARDCEQVPAKVLRDGHDSVRDAVEFGTYVTRQTARRAAGPHGSNYFKRVSGEMTAPLVGEWGPEGPPKSDYVGVSGSAGATRDLATSADPAAERLAASVRGKMAGWFW